MAVRESAVAGLAMILAASLVPVVPATPRPSPLPQGRTERCLRLRSLCGVACPALCLRGGRDCLETRGLWSCLDPAPAWRVPAEEHGGSGAGCCPAEAGRELLHAVRCAEQVCRLCTRTCADLDALLLAAADSGDAGEVEALVQHGASVTASNTRPHGRLVFPLDGVGWTPLHFAAARGHSACVRRLWQLGAEPAHTTPLHQWTPLHLAAAFGHVQTSELLIDLGCPVDARASGVQGGGERGAAGVGWGGATALHIAAAMAQEHTIEALHRLQANASLTDFSGRTALEIAAEAAAFWGAAGQAPLIPGQESTTAGSGCGGGGGGGSSHASGLVGVPDAVASAVKLLRRIHAYTLHFDAAGARMRLGQAYQQPSGQGPGGASGEPLVALPLRSLAQDEETESVGKSTGGDTYSGYASAFGAHKPGSWQWRAARRQEGPAHKTYTV